MPHRDSPWPHRDNELRWYQSQGMEWGEIAVRMHLSTAAVRSRGKRIGLDNSQLTSTNRLPIQKAAQREYKGQVVATTRSTLPPLPSLEMPMPEIHIEDNDVNDC